MPILLPLLGLKFYVERNKNYVILFSLILAMISWNAFSSVHMATNDYGFFTSVIDQGLIVALERTHIYSVVSIWLGDMEMGRIFSHPALAFWSVLLLLSSSLLYLLFRSKHTPKIKFEILGLMGSIGIYFVLVVSTRPYLWNLFSRYSGELFWGGRYVFEAVSIGMLVWIGALSRFPTIVPRIASLLFLFNMWNGHTVADPRPDAGLSAILERVEKLSPGVTSELIPIQPRNYSAFQIILKK